MNKSVEIQVDKTEFNLLEEFIDQISDEFQLHDTYYGNISIALANVFELVLVQSGQKQLSIHFDARHEGLVFALKICMKAFKQTFDKLPDETSLLLNRVADDYVFDEENGYLRLYFDTKSVFSLTAKHRTNLLKDYLAGRTTKTQKKNDYFQRH